SNVFGQEQENGKIHSTSYDENQARFLLPGSIFCQEAANSWRHYQSKVPGGLKHGQWYNSVSPWPDVRDGVSGNRHSESSKETSDEAECQHHRDIGAKARPICDTRKNSMVILKMISEKDANNNGPTAKPQSVEMPSVETNREQS
ncbi:MAG: hypothetical protein LQ348_005800, partial [Seirophora lacunosa]